MRGVGLALIHERCVGIGGVAETVRTCHDSAPRQNHEPRVGRQIIAIAQNMVIASNQRIVGLKRHEDRAITTVGDFVETVIKELTEDREQTVKWR